jgi:hypothetical protein
MVRIVKAQEKEKKKPGRKPKLIVEDQILIMLQYLREYRTYYHIGKEAKRTHPQNTIGNSTKKWSNYVLT